MQKMYLNIQWNPQYEEYCRLGCDGMQRGRSLWMFHRNIVPPLLGSKSKLSRHKNNHSSFSFNSYFIIEGNFLVNMFLGYSVGDVAGK